VRGRLAARLDGGVRQESGRRGRTGAPETAPTTDHPRAAAALLHRRLLCHPPSSHRKFADVAPPFPTPPPPPPPVFAASRLRSWRGEVTAGAASLDAARPIASKSSTTTTTTFVDADLMKRAPAPADQRLNCSSTNVAACEPTRDVTVPVAVDKL